MSVSVFAILNVGKKEQEDMLGTAFSTGVRYMDNTMIYIKFISFFLVSDFIQIFSVFVFDELFGQNFEAGRIDESF